MNYVLGLSKTEEIVLMAMFLADGCWDQLGVSQKQGLEFLQEYIKTLRFDDSDDIAKVVRKELYLYMRNTLMATRKGDLFYLQNHPAFSNWGRSNITRLAESHALGGPALVRRAMDEIFHPGWQRDRPQRPVIGFDENLGDSKETAIRIYNAPGHEDGVEAEYWYLHYKYGKARSDWTVGMQMVTEDRENGRTYDVLHIEFPDGRERAIFFDISEFYS